MELNRKAEVSLHGQAADIEWTMERRGERVWILYVEDKVSHLTRVFSLSDSQASATLALFIGELIEHEELNAALYEIAEEVWSNVPSEFRMIP